jgi:hypothetical protein
MHDADLVLSIEVVLKPQIAFESKTQADENAQHKYEYVSTLKRSATQLSDARWVFKTTSKTIETLERRLMMKSTTAKFFALTIVSIFMAAFMARSPALAAGEDKGKNQSTPSGWEQGNKTGWEGDTPPGLTEEKLEKKKKAGKKSGKHKAKVKKEGEKAKHEAELKKEKNKSEMEGEKERSAEEIEKAKKKMNDKEG